MQTAGMQNDSQSPMNIGGHNSNIFLIFSTIIMVFYYSFILSNGSFNLFMPLPFGMTFNSMLQHLMQGQFDVDPPAVGDEGFQRDGHVYAYWGIFCAVIRFPLLLFQSGLTTDVTTLSCLIAVCLTGTVKLRALLFVRRHCIPNASLQWVFALFATYIVLGGEQVGYLRPSVYQEVLFWASVFASTYVYFVVRGIIAGRFSHALLAAMSALSAVALLDRVSTGLGLYLATGLLLVSNMISDVGRTKSNSVNQTPIRTVLNSIFSRQILLPGMIMALGVLATGVVNWRRWGNPLTFADYSLYLYNRFYPDRILRTKEYGLFNLGRIPIGLEYYFAPVFDALGGKAPAFFKSAEIRLLDATELPPSSLFLTDLLPMLFAAKLARSDLRTQTLSAGSRRQALALAIGLAFPCLLMLTAISMNYRYRMEFYPEIDMLALLGLYVSVANSDGVAYLSKCRGWLALAVFVSVVFAHVELVLYKLSELGPSQELLRNGVLDYYSSVLTGSSQR